MLKLKASKYDQEILDRCYKGKHEYLWTNLMYNPKRFWRCYHGKQGWICKTCDRYLKKKISPRSHANSLELDPILDMFVDEDGKG